MFIIIYFFQGVEGSWLLGLLAHADHCGTTCQNDDDGVDSFGDGCGFYEDYPTYCDSADEYATDGFDATDKCCICTCTVYTNSSCPSGDRVQRGRDWDYDSYGREDGVVGLGTVTGTAPPRSTAAQEPQCWIRMPTGCGQALDETQTPTVWFVDHSVSDAVACAEKVAAYNSWCSKSDGEHDWRTSWCEVTWDQGGSDRYPYRVGAQGAHDLCSAASKKPVSDLPAVFTRVSSSLQWIRATLPELRCNLYTQAHTRTHAHTHTHTLTYSYTHTHTHTHTLTYSYIYIYILYVYVSAHTLNSSE